MTVTRRKDSQTPRVIMHKIADIRGGVSVNTAELTQDWLAEGTPLSAPVNGICHVVKVAKVQANASNSATDIQIYKGHNFKVGDIVFAVASGKAYAITAIDTSAAGYDVITVGTTLGVALTKDESYIMQAAASGASGAAFKYAPVAIVGTGKPVVAGNNLDTDAWVVGVTLGNDLPEAVKSALKGIVNL